MAGQGRQPEAHVHGTKGFAKAQGPNVSFLVAWDISRLQSSTRHLSTGRGSGVPHFATCGHRASPQRRRHTEQMALSGLLFVSHVLADKRKVMLIKEKNVRIFISAPEGNDQK